MPLTRIRDIAHRNDIPHDLKQEIKHTLQNKVHYPPSPHATSPSACHGSLGQESIGMSYTWG